LDAFNELLLKSQEPMLRFRFLTDLTKRKKGETKKQWLQRREKEWHEFKKQQRQNEKFYQIVRKCMKDNPKELIKLHLRLVRKLVSLEDRVLADLNRLSFNFDPSTGKYSALIIRLDASSIQRYGLEEAFDLWNDSVIRTHKAYKLVKEAIEKETVHLNKLELLLETLLFESRDFPQNRELLESIRVRLEKTTPYFGFLVDVAEVIRDKLIPLLYAKNN